MAQQEESDDDAYYYTVFIPQLFITEEKEDPVSDDGIDPSQASQPPNDEFHVDQIVEVQFINQELGLVWILSQINQVNTNGSYVITYLDRSTNKPITDVPKTAIRKVQDFKEGEKIKFVDQRIVKTDIFISIDGDITNIDSTITLSNKQNLKRKRAYRPVNQDIQPLSTPIKPGESSPFVSPESKPLGIGELSTVGFKVGDIVEVKFQNHVWVLCRVSQINNKGENFLIKKLDDFVEGDLSVPATDVRRVKNLSQNENILVFDHDDEEFNQGVVTEDYNGDNPDDMIAIEIDNNPSQVARKYIYRPVIRGGRAKTKKYRSLKKAKKSLKRIQLNKNILS